jgi:hypothetical protein
MTALLVPGDSDPLSDRKRWADFLSDPHNPRVWTVTAAAISTVDAAWASRPSTDDERGDEAWCRDVLHAAADPQLNRAARHISETLPQDACFLDVDLMRAWLTAPAPYSYRGEHVITDLELVVWHEVGLADIQAAADELLEAAQRTGLLGVHDHGIELHRLVNANDRPGGWLVALRHDCGHALTSRVLGEQDLFPDGPMDRVDAAVQVLRDVSAVVEGMLATQRLRTTPPAPTPPVRGQAFLAASRPTTATTTPTVVAPPAVGSPSPGRPGPIR